MDELTLLRAHRPEFGPVQDEPPAHETARFEAELRAASSARRGRRATARPRRTLRLTLPGRAGWLVPVAAATVAVGLVVGGVTLASDRGAPAPTTARQVLLAAAAQAERQPFTPPAAGTFVYTRTRVQRDAATATEEYWLSADGKAPGRFTRSSAPNDTAIAPSPGPSDTVSADGGWTGPIDPCPGTTVSELEQASPGSYCMGPGYLADVPTDPAEAVLYLQATKGWNGWFPFHAGGPDEVRPDIFLEPSPDRFVGNLTDEVLAKHLLPPPAWAALFSGLANLPGALLVLDAPTLDGRSGIAVRFRLMAQDTEPEPHIDLIFDPETYTLIGYRGVGLADWKGGGYPADAKVRQAVIEESAVVSAAGVRPDGSRAP